MTEMAQELLDVPAHVQAIETRLAALDTALRASDPLAMDAACAALQKELAEAMAAFHHAAAEGRNPLTPELVQRLRLAQIRVTDLQPVLHRAIGSIDRTLGVMLTVDPRDDQATYQALGQKAGPSRLAAAYKG
jgi:hypothetical protein